MGITKNHESADKIVEEAKETKDIPEDRLNEDTDSRESKTQNLA